MHSRALKCGLRFPIVNNFSKLLSMPRVGSTVMLGESWSASSASPSASATLERFSFLSIFEVFLYSIMGQRNLWSKNVRVPIPIREGKMWLMLISLFSVHTLYIYQD